MTIVVNSYNKRFAPW